MAAGLASDVTTDAPAPRFSFRLLERRDLPLLQRWLATEHVSRWWGRPLSSEEIEEQHGSRIGGDDPTVDWIVDLDGRPIGFVQAYRIADYPDHSDRIGRPDAAAGVDLYLGEPELIGRGIGPAMLRAFCSEVVFIRWPPGEVDRIIADPDPTNERSVRAFQKAGFHLGAVVDATDTEPRGQLVILERDAPVSPP
jgi:RimJ/RimL family protein N-acetyltransferase